MPLSSLWQKVDPRTQTPIYAVWGVVVFSFILGLPMLGDSAAFGAILSLSTIALHISYVSPTLARLTWGAPTTQAAVLKWEQMLRVVGGMPLCFRHCSAG